MVAVMVLGIGIVAIASMQTTSTKNGDKAWRTIADTVTTGVQLEQILAVPYSDLLIADLDDGYRPQTPDHGPFNIDGNNGTIEWEVDDDFPSDHTKRITVTVRRPGKGGVVKSVQYSYIKVRGCTP